MVWHRVIYLHGPEHTENIQTIQSLSPFWCHTNFIERAVHVVARHFMEVPPGQKIVQNIVQRDRNHSWGSEQTMACDIDFIAPSPKNKIAIVIEGIHELYPDNENALEDSQMEGYLSGRMRLKEFLKEVDSKIAEKDRYLIITGQKDADWWESEVDLNIAGQAFSRNDRLQFHFRMNQTFFNDRE
jgi:hypothetical protein